MDTVSEINELLFVENGKSEFTIWVAEDLYCNSPEVTEKLLNICKSIQKKTGAKLSIKKDSDATSADLTKPGILIGVTSFAESISLNESMKDQDYFVGLSGNKILIYSKTEKGCKTALEYFQNKVLNGQAVVNNSLKMTNELGKRYDHDYAIESISCCGTELKNFRIVISQKATVNETVFANFLRYHLKEKYGHVLEIVDDSEPATANEIVVGLTTRNFESIGLSEFKISVSNENLNFLADDLRSYETLYSYVSDTFFGNAQKKIVLDNGFSYVGTADNNLFDGTVTASERLGDIRVMYYNVFNTTQTCGGPEVRQPLQEEILATYLPDVLGTQEFSSYYHADFAPILKKLGYDSISTPAGSKNYTELWYRTSHLTVVESGWHLFSGPNDANSKSCTWAVFEVKSSGKRFAVMNAHWMWAAPGIDQAAALEENAKETLDILNTILAKHGNISVIFGGDLNTNSTRATALKSLNALKSSGKFKYAWDIAESKNDRNSCGEYAVYDSELKTYIDWDVKADKTYVQSLDHAFVTNSTVVKRFVTLVSLYTYWASDHHPIVVEFDLN